MRRTFLLGALAALIAAAFLHAPAQAQPAPPLAGVWTLNRPLSEFPADIGFNPAWMTAPLADAQSGDSGRGGRGGRGGGGRQNAAAPFAAKPESYEDA
ncbi:MAG: hypothetical protein JWL71_3795, partial [Acidobacteria bacterium]|nr:hypothetical protein [Acidobacteriota bacterium]